MPDPADTGDAILEVIFTDNSRHTARITASPFLIGRAEAANHLRLADLRVSRQSAAIRREGGSYVLVDNGQQGGLFVNGKTIETHVLRDGDVITFGSADSCEVVFRAVTQEEPAAKLLERIGSAGSDLSSASGVNKLNLLLGATMLLRSQLPLDAVLGTMLDHAIAVTQADRALLLEADSSGALRARLGRRSGGLSVQPDSFAPSQTALRVALEQRSSVITEDLARAEYDLQAAQSVVAQRLRAVVVIPLYATAHAEEGPAATETVAGPSGGEERGDFLGVVYLDSRRPAAFSQLDRQILDALAVEAASMLDNARLVQREMERQRFEQELKIAREVQQALLPKNFGDFPHLGVSGVNLPSQTASGDYFDVFPTSGERAAFLIADVSGKGLGGALLTTILQGALLGLAAGADARDIFKNLNEFLCGHSLVDRYATVFFAMLGADGRLEYINAGHPSPLLLRGGEVTRPFTEGSVPVGLIPEAEYETATKQLQPGDTLILFSDGVTEAMYKDEEFGMVRLEAVATAQRDEPLDALKARILEAITAFTRGAAQSDDVTLLLVRFVGAPS